MSSVLDLAVESRGQPRQETAHLLVVVEVEVFSCRVGWQVLILVWKRCPERLLVIRGRRRHVEHLLAVEVAGVHIDDVGERVGIGESGLRPDPTNGPGRK